MSIYKRGNVYWYKFMWNGKVIRRSTRQKNDKKARNAESKYRALLTEQQEDAEAARNRLGCADVLKCHECEKFFNADKAIRKEDTVFCTTKCAKAWGKARTMTTLQRLS